MQQRDILVTARAGGFRRAGRAWPADSTHVSAGSLTDDQYAAVLAEANLDAAGDPLSDDDPARLPEPGLAVIFPGPPEPESSEPESSESEPESSESEPEPARPTPSRRRRRGVINGA